MIKYLLILIVAASTLQAHPQNIRTKVSIALVSGVGTGLVVYVLTNQKEYHPYTDNIIPLSSHKKLSLYVTGELSHKTTQALLAGIVTSVGVFKILSIEPIKKPEA